MRNQENQVIVEPHPPFLELYRDSTMFVSASFLHFQAQDMYKLIEVRAYERYKKRGAHGDDWQDWFVAEREVQLPVPVEDWWEGNTYVVSAGVPGFRENEIRIGRGEGHFIISGTRREEPGRLVQQAKWIHRCVSLPEGLDLRKATAKLIGERLIIKVPKKAVAHGSF
jgi:HSP20 family molecular chaperone IbpA